ncbi:MAG: CHC2 zinc finger domain-containing protein, partial [Bdellovibrionales bacterium]
MIERRDTAGASAPSFRVKPRVRLTEIHHYSLAQEIERANAAHDLVALIGRVVRLVRDGDKWRGFCPFHGDKRISTFVVDAKNNHYSCSACGAEGDALSWIMHEQGLNFHQVVAISLKQPISTSFKQKDSIRNAVACATVPPSDESVRRHKRELAKKVWDESRAATNTLVERHLFAQGIVFDGPLPDVLRFHPNLCHEPSRQFFPAMIAAAHKPDGTFSGIHRTYLSPNGAETANVVQGGVKRMLGECFGAHVHIHKGSANCVAIAEGIEAALAIS